MDKLITLTNKIDALAFTLFIIIVAVGLLILGIRQILKALKKIDR